MAKNDVKNDEIMTASTLYDTNVNERRIFQLADRTSMKLKYE